MNVFYLDENPTKCAEYHCDKHVVKMIVETAQLLSTAHHVLDRDVAPRLYKKTHVNHPCAVWVRQSSAHYCWAYRLFATLSEEYYWRYGGKIHRSFERLEHPLGFIPLNMPESVWVDPPQAMPEIYRGPNTVQAYRRYYREGKAHLLTYRNREKPEWL